MGTKPRSSRDPVSYTHLDVYKRQAYYFVISGDTTGTKGGRYSYDVLTTAVPEPESYALFLAGLGIMGAIARRRSKAAV